MSYRASDGASSGQGMRLLGCCAPQRVLPSCEVETLQDVNWSLRYRSNVIDVRGARYDRADRREIVRLDEHAHRAAACHPERDQRCAGSHILLRRILPTLSVRATQIVFARCYARGCIPDGLGSAYADQVSFEQIVLLGFTPSGRRIRNSRRSCAGSHQDQSLDEAAHATCRSPDRDEEDSSADAFELGRRRAKVRSRFDRTPR